ncbi:cupin domain-containing protein [Spirosoma sp. HMF4905]|uniref:Cupin domain-containing protein n=1 Tax=Spirosoma arboris TaxID=2682092 RepID=A0A7K1SIM3_9BACT|nr:cupin domain-containing protein [Spirosoma arboris]MVM33667.1 cupin domain-containing protein [Spirosoma arboris]
MRIFLLCWAVVLTSFPVFSQPIKSNVYSAAQSPIFNQSGYEERTLLEGSTRDFSHLIVQVITVLANQPDRLTQQLDEEAVLIIKAGELTLTLGEKRKTLRPGSAVMIMPGDEYQIENKAAQPLTYYFIRYTSNEVPDLDLYRLMGNSFWVDWREVPSVSDNHRESRRLLAPATIMSSRIVMQVTKLDPGSRSDAPHSHRAAELLLILGNPVQVNLDGTLKVAKAGDVVFVESDVYHAIQNSNQEGSTYLSFQF